MLTFHFFSNTCHEKFSNTRGSRKNVPVQTHSPSSRRGCTIYCACSPPALTRHPAGWSPWAAATSNHKLGAASNRLYPVTAGRPELWDQGLQGWALPPAGSKANLAGPPPAPGVASILVLGWWLRCPVSACVITSPPPLCVPSLSHLMVSGGHRMVSERAGTQENRSPGINEFVDAGVTRAAPGGGCLNCKSRASSVRASRGRDERRGWRRVTPTFILLHLRLHF